MYIRGIGVDIVNPHGSAASAADTKPVFQPRSWLAWSKSLERAIEDHGSIGISIGSTAYPDRIAIAIGHSDLIEDPSRSLDGGDTFGFVTGLTTLRQLRSALDVAITALEG